MISFDRIRSMYPSNLNREWEPPKYLNQCPHLLQFVRPQSRIDKNALQEYENTNNQKSEPILSCYKSKRGVTYGLF